MVKPIALSAPVVSCSSIKSSGTFKIRSKWPISKFQRTKLILSLCLTDLRQYLGLIVPSHASIATKILPCWPGLRIHAHCTDPAELETYSQAIRELRDCYIVVYQSATALEASDIFAWLFQISDQYLTLLKGRTQEALSIFAFFCVVPRKLEMHWWMEGFSSHVMSQIYELLDEEHRLWIRWPIDEIGVSLSLLLRN